MSKTKTAQRSSRRSGNALVLTIVVAVIALAALIAMLVTGGDDERGVATAPVEVSGEQLPPLEGEADPAVGMRAPAIEGQDFDGGAVSVQPGEGPVVLVFLAHWCPVCQREVSDVQEWIDAGEMPDGVRMVAVTTGTDSSRPNYPPAAWLEREGWTSEVLVDDEAGTAAHAYGLPAYPFFAFVGGDGTVVGRYAGAIPVEELGTVMAQLRDL